jgi:hypothetical protein
MTEAEFDDLQHHSRCGWRETRNEDLPNHRLTWTVDAPEHLRVTITWNSVCGRSFFKKDVALFLELLFLELLQLHRCSKSLRATLKANASAV